MDDGAYLIGRSTSYVNPLSGKTEDGGSNIALGDSMVASIVENQLLVEQVQGKLYLTIGLGLASNVSNVRFQLMNSDGSKTSVAASVTGSSQSNGDTVNHYRIQISSLTQYISPTLYVAPMGRDVQFFIQLNTASITSGTGVYRSELAPVQGSNDQSVVASSNETTATTQENNETETTKNNEKSKTKKVENISKKALFKGVKGLSIHTVKANSDSSSYKVYGIVIVGIALLGAGGFYYVKKKQK